MWHENTFVFLLLVFFVPKKSVGKAWLMKRCSLAFRYCLPNIYWISSLTTRTKTKTCSNVCVSAPVYTVSCFEILQWFGYVGCSNLSWCWTQKYMFCCHVWQQEIWKRKSQKSLNTRLTSHPCAPGGVQLVFHCDEHAPASHQPDSEIIYCFSLFQIMLDFRVRLIEFSMHYFNSRWEVVKYYRSAWTRWNI